MDKQVIRLMRDRTEGNTMAKVWRQVLESHCEEYLQRKDLWKDHNSDIFSFSVEAKTKLVRQRNSAESSKHNRKPSL